jgi:hypothetical protein
VIGTLAQSRYPQVALAPSRDLIRLRTTWRRPAWRTNARCGRCSPRLAAFGRPAEGAAGRHPETAEEADNALFRINLIRVLALEAED